MNVLEVRGISKSFGGVKAVTDFSMTMKENDIIGVIGPNGAGKTTIFNVISGVYKQDSGQIFLGENDITNKEQHERARLGVARTFQNIRLFKGLSLLENVSAALDPTARYNIFHNILLSRKMRMEEKRIKEESERFLELVGLLKYQAEKPENLSYGYQRKLEIARALAIKPKVLLLDEPAAGLNPKEVVDLINLIRKISQDLDLSILIIEHRMEVIMELCRFIYVQNFGKTIAYGTPKEIQENEEVIKAYLGEED